jgi:pectate lyase
LKKLGLHIIFVDLGEVDVMENITIDQRQELKARLLNLGFELMDDKRSVLIKNVIVEMVYHTDKIIKVNFSIYLSE